MPYPKDLHCILNCLPFDVIIYILQLPCLDVNEVMTLAEALPQYIEICIYVLRIYQLPRLGFQTIMDQEGKKQYPTPFVFHSLDIDCRRATFVVQPGLSSVSKRYISNKATAARPRLRQITLHRIPTSSSRVRSLDKPINSISSFNNSIVNIPSWSDYLLDLEKVTSSGIVVDHLEQQKQCRSEFAFPDSLNMIRSHRLSLKKGFHKVSTISTSHNCLQQIRSNDTSRSSLSEKWQYSYYASYTNETIEAEQWLTHIFDEKKANNGAYKPKMEHMYILPISITVPLPILRLSYISTNSATSVMSSNAPWYKRQFKTALKKIGLD